MEACGFEIVEQNFRSRYGELDLVARDERFLVFCEVKTRVMRRDSGQPGPFAAIGALKQRQVRSMAREWLGRGRLGGPRPPELRFDAIGVSFDATGELVAIDHVEAAF